MADVDIEELNKLVAAIVNKASQDGTMNELTPRMIRKKAEEDMGLAPGDLDSYKNAVKQAANATIDALEANEQACAKDNNEEPAKKSPPTKPAEKRKSKSAQSETPASKKAKVASKEQKPKRAQKQTSTKGSSGKNAKAVRSASVIPSSDEDEKDNDKMSSNPPSKPQRPNLLKNTSAHDADISTVDIGDLPVKSHKRTEFDNHNEATGERNLNPKVSVSLTAEPVEPDNEAKVDTGTKSDSEMSVLIDGPPAKKAGPRKKKAGAPEPKKKRKAAGSAQDSPEDQEVKRLKSTVVACGVHKVWSREFKDIAEDKAAQIRRLKEMLVDLGMSGRVSMEKAKAIKQKRELAQELEDVQKFEKAIVSGPKRSRRQAAQESSGGNESDVEDLTPSARKKSSARQSIMAFLGDQSDEE
ncbi:hypothetical protein BC835DRAFT_1356959 [Cytidiella melzeri]|nr:hypothetical protein BC835DRAFT_1356959 [Cytidiella melzeri]